MLSSCVERRCVAKRKTFELHRMGSILTSRLCFFDIGIGVWMRRRLRYATDYNAEHLQQSKVLLRFAA